MRKRIADCIRSRYPVRRSTWALSLVFLAAQFAFSATSGIAQAAPQPPTAPVTPQNAVPQNTDGRSQLPLPPTYGTVMMSDEQSGDIQAMDQTALPANNQAGNIQSADSVSMPADEIIDILKQQPDILATVKNSTARQLGVDPSSITNDALFTRIQQDANLRSQISKQLGALGYSTSLSDPAKTPTTPNGRPDTSSTDPKLTPRVRPVPPRPVDEGDRNEPQVQRSVNPYGNLPSLRDLYAQLPASGGKLKRFGSDVYQLGTGNTNELAMDVPVGPDYVLGPGDILVVNIWGGRSGQLNRPIDRQGQIDLPEMGSIPVAGLTVAQAQTAIGKALGTQFQNVHVELSLGRLRTVRIYVVGDVQRPGAYDISSLSTPLNALYVAGGPTSKGSLRTLRQYRGNNLVQEYDLYDFLLKGLRSVSDRLQPGDTLIVPPVGAQVSVAGMVRRPAIYELRKEHGLQEVLDLAGGTLVSSNLKNISVERIEAHERRTMINVQLPERPDATVPGTGSFQIQDGDSVLVTQILPYNQQAVYLDGHVFRPGKFPYREGMTAADLLHSYQDLMPEPADHAEIIRLRAPDFRPETITISLHDVLAGNDAIQLQPFDLIRVFGRYQIDPPKVFIYGEVLRSGEYPLAENMTVAGLVQSAGGFKRSAYRDVADLTSYSVQGNEKVVLEHQSVDLAKALQGDRAADLILKPGDVVSIRQLNGWQDIGAAITVSGEVAHAGTYGIQAGERLSTIIRRAGGFRENAFPAGAILERVQVRELGEVTRQQMIQRLETTPANVSAGLGSAQDQAALQQAAQQQQQQIITSLRSHPASGRQVIKISSDVSKWENTPADIEIRSGDVLKVPKRPNFVIVSGQVYNGTAISYVPGKDVSWYLSRAGGATKSGEKKDLFVVRADGSVVGHGSTWTNSNVLHLRMQPGDSIVVPEKIIGGSQTWKNVVALAQIMSSIAITGAVAGIF